jgi:hypothetical protein
VPLINRAPEVVTLMVLEKVFEIGLVSVRKFRSFFGFCVKNRKSKQRKNKEKSTKNTKN